MPTAPRPNRNTTSPHPTPPQTTPSPIVTPLSCAICARGQRREARGEKRPCALIITLALLTCTLSSPHPALASPPEPLTDAHRKLIWEASEDLPTEEFAGFSPELAARHYLTSDEFNLHLFYEPTKDLGGAYAGVGSDQAYILIGWQRPQVAWLIDYDLWISYIHLIHHALILTADTPDAYLFLWTDFGAPQAIAALNDFYKDRTPAELDFLRDLYSKTRLQIHPRLDKLRKLLRTHGIPSYLDDPDTYAFVRAMIREKRIRPMVGNLLETRALPSIAAATRALGLPLRVLYLSNAEQYWTYSENFRANIQALPFDAPSLILRTLGAKAVNGDYRYNTQPALNFRAWISLPHITHVYDIIPRPPLLPTEIPLSHADAPPPTP